MRYLFLLLIMLLTQRVAAAENPNDGRGYWKKEGDPVYRLVMFDYANEETMEKNGYRRATPQEIEDHWAYWDKVNSK